MRHRAMMCLRNNVQCKQSNMNDHKEAISLLISVLCVCIYILLSFIEGPHMFKQMFKSCNGDKVIPVTSKSDAVVLKSIFPYGQ